MNNFHVSNVALGAYFFICKSYVTMSGYASLLVHGLDSTFGGINGMSTYHCLHDMIGIDVFNKGEIC